MATYARVNSENIVTYLTDIPDEIITDINGNKHEEWGLGHLYNSIPYSLNDKWILSASDYDDYDNLTSNFRKKPAQIGDTWNEQLDAFILPKPFESWIFDEQLCNWKAPIDKPQAHPEERYIWNETIGNWELIPLT